jgi:hypothetical protein
LHLPAPALRDAVGVIEKLTGTSSAWFDLNGKTIRGGGRRHHGVIAQSSCGGWMIQRRMENLGNAAGLIRYIAKEAGIERVKGQHRLSHALASLGRDAPKKFA